LEPKPWNFTTVLSSNTFRCMCLVVVVPVSIILGVFLFVESESSDDGSCFVEQSCSAVSQFYDPVTGFTNDTGWASSESLDCCSICLPGTPTKVCFDPDDADCAAHAGVAGDYDYVMLDQMWLPQYCNALAQGHDPTLSHLPGTKCSSGRSISSSLVIHGLWPNYYGGYPQCCAPVDGSAQVPLVPEDVVLWSPTWSELQAVWYDPTSAPHGSSGSDSNECNVCYILNHEWLKHGTCFQQSTSAKSGKNGAAGVEDPQGYFHAGIEINNALSAESSALARYANQNTDRANLESLYPHAVNILCDPQDPKASSTQGVLLEIQTCWTVTEVDGQVEPTYQMVDCPPAGNSTFTVPCPNTVWLKGYLGPDQ
jgi:ribonuclease T2